jgi:hypothetical protein
VTEETILALNKRALCESFSCNLVGVRSEARAPPPLTEGQVNQMISETLAGANSLNESVFEEISQILFGGEKEMKDEMKKTAAEIDPSKAADFQANYLFNKFHHLFDYDATYYSYLIAKVAS